MISYYYNSLNHANADWLIDKILESGGVITTDSFSGELLENKATSRLVRLEFDCLIVEFECSNQDCAMVIFANDGHKQILMQSSSAILTNKEMSMIILADYNTMVKRALDSAAQARMKQLHAMNKPNVKPNVKPRGGK